MFIFPFPSKEVRCVLIQEEICVFLMPKVLYKEGLYIIQDPSATDNVVGRSSYDRSVKMILLALEILTC